MNKTDYYFNEKKMDNVVHYLGTGSFSILHYEYYGSFFINKKM